MSEKTELLKGAETELAAFKRAIAGLDEERMREAWLGTWSVREIVAHISGWHRELGPALLRMSRGERPIPEGVSYDDVDAWNARFADGRKAASTALILKELDASHAAFLEAAAAVPEERYVPGKTAHKIVDLNSRHHYQEHRAQIEEWRGRTRV
ncbi:MAG TPA: ClbS/DfsB family four-helix bundle protein [Methylomirabilota bacterium]|nr:ClbS/DfsB family four-helix bundle protein [Methylomirabilota bacterium]